MLTFTTNDPKSLIAAFDKAISSRLVTTWEKDGNGFYGHKATQWAHKAFYQVKSAPQGLVFNLICVTGNVPLQHDRLAVFSFYHGHLIETFTNHFGYLFTSAISTSKPTSADTGF